MTTARRRGLAAEGQKCGQNAKLTNGCVGKQGLHVPMADGCYRANEHSDAPESEQGPEPQWVVAEGGMQAGQEVDARFDHGGGMQIGACRRRRGHCPGQPPVKGKLGRT